jgi:hypothetical protein
VTQAGLSGLAQGVAVVVESELRRLFYFCFQEGIMGRL